MNEEMRGARRIAVGWLCIHPLMSELHHRHTGGRRYLSYVLGWTPAYAGVTRFGVSINWLRRRSAYLAFAALGLNANITLPGI
jgi:hypothetical protein